MPTTDHGKRLVAKELARYTHDSRVRLILTLARHHDTSENAPTPDMFASRVAFRQAAIAHQSKMAVGDIDSAVARLKALGLETKSYPVTRTVIAEGTVDRLCRALEEPYIERVSVDKSLSLIEPVKCHEQVAGKRQKRSEVEPALNEPPCVQVDMGAFQPGQAVETD